MSLRDRRRRQRIDDPVPVKPFLAWFHERVERHTRRGEENPRVRALADIGWDNDAGNRRLIRWQSWWAREKKGASLRGRGDLVARADVEDALTRAETRMWELVASRSGDGVCTHPRGRESTLRGRPRDVLAYIDGVLAAPLTDRGLFRCELRERLMFMQRAEYVEDEREELRGYCGVCREDVATDETGACLWCDALTEHAQVHRAFSGALAAAA